VTKVEKIGEATRLHAAAIDESLSKLDKKVLILEGDMDKRIEGEGVFQASINEKVAVISDTHKSLSTSVNNCSKNLSTFKDAQTVKEAEAKKRMDDLRRDLKQTDLKVGDVFQQKQAANAAYDLARRADEIVNAQGAMFQELEGKLEDHTSLIPELQVAASTRKDELQLFREQTSQWQEATTDLQSWKQVTDTKLEQLLRTEASWSLETSNMKDQTRQKRGRYQASTSQISSDLQSPTKSSPLSHGDRVWAQFTNGKWYDGNIQGNYPKGHLVLFDGFESDGASKIDFHLIKPYTQVNASFTSADQASSAQTTQITSTPQGNEGQPPADEHTQQEDGDDDGSDNTGSGTGGWGSGPRGSTPSAFRPFSDEPYCATRAIHDDRVRDLKQKLEEERAHSAVHALNPSKHYTIPGTFLVSD
jgi:hypothetical protein